jgi:DNA repair protein RadC
MTDTESYAVPTGVQHVYAKFEEGKANANIFGVGFVNTTYTEVDYVTENVAVLIKLMPAMLRYYQVEKVRGEMALVTIKDCGDYLKHFFLGRKIETVFMLCLDAKCGVLACREVGEGSVNSANVPIRRVVEIALAEGASTVILAHNHPSGIAVPSGEDIATTRRLATALSTVDVILADHIVVAGDDYVSMAQSGIHFDDCLI